MTWEKPDVLTIRGSGTLRAREGWSVFAVGKGRACWRAIEIGHQNQTEAEVLSGISVGELVILYPPNQLREGVAVRTQ